ncbi:unnamed protein product, partial [Ectocarpus sp. 12 AP-2014]
NDFHQDGGLRVRRRERGGRRRCPDLSEERRTCSSVSRPLDGNGDRQGPAFSSTACYLGATRNRPARRRDPPDLAGRQGPSSRARVCFYPIECGGVGFLLPELGVAQHEPPFAFGWDQQRRELPSAVLRRVGTMSWGGRSGIHAENGMVQFRPLSPSVRIFEFDLMSRDNPLPGPEGRRCEVQFPIDTISGGDGEVHAIVCWWRCFMDEDRTIVMSTFPLPPPKASSKFRAEPPASTPPHRDHWRQSVYLLSRPVQVEAGDTVGAIACHDDNTVWFEAVAADTSRRSAGSGRTVHHDGVIAGAGVPTLGTSAASRGIDNAFGPPGGKVGRHEHDWERETISRETSVRSFPPVCVCGLHRTCPPSRIQMLNDQHRTDAFRSAIRAILVGTRKAQTQHDNRTAATAVDSDAEIVRVATGEKRRRTASACVACISDGFLLPLLAAQEGAFEVLEIQPSTAYRAMCRDVYLANGIDIGEGAHGNDQSRVIRQFPGGILNVYELLTPTSADSDQFGLAGLKLDAVVGEPFFADLSTAAWSLESLLLFWCARTALEARGCFSPRTKVMPA